MVEYIWVDSTRPQDLLSSLLLLLPLLNAEAALTLDQSLEHQLVVLCYLLHSLLTALSIETHDAFRCYAQFMVTHWYDDTYVER